MVLKADWLYSSLLSRDQRIIHGFSTRCLMSGEGDATTKEQCESLISSLHIDPSRLQLMKQVHKDQISFIDTQSSIHPEVDAMTTDQPRIALGIRTADCVPVLMFDPILRVIAAVHAGWRGAVAQLPLKTIREMSIRFGSKPEQIWVAIGPAIGVCCYEVGPEVLAYFPSSYVLHDDHLDLPGAVIGQLEEAGVHRDHIDWLKICTACEEARFFSHRRDQGSTGRHLSLIMLK